MGMHELNSFVRKFSNLRKMGYSATLKAETHAGKEWVELHVDLVLVHPEEGDQGNVQHGNARHRRKEQRVEANHSS